MILFVHPRLYRRRKIVQDILDWLLIAVLVSLTGVVLIDTEHRGQAIVGLIAAPLIHAAVSGFIEGFLRSRTRPTPPKS